MVRQLRRPQLVRRLQQQLQLQQQVPFCDGSIEGSVTEAFCSAFLRGPVDQDRVVTTGESCVGVEDGTRWMDGWMDGWMWKF